MTSFEILLLAGAADIKLSRKPGLNIYKLGFMLKNSQNTIFFTIFTLKTEFLWEYYSPQASSSAKQNHNNTRKTSIYSCFQTVKARIKSSRQR